MASLKDLAKQIESAKLEDSKVLELQGPNVRTPSLIPGQIYLARTWKVIREDSDNPFMVLRFLGSGHTGNGERKMNQVNPRIKDMGHNDFYFFDHYTDGKTSELNAYQSDHCLVIGDNAVRITFFEINGVTEQTKSTKTTSTKDSSKPRVARAKKSEVADESPKTKRIVKARTPRKSKNKEQENITSNEDNNESAETSVEINASETHPPTDIEDTQPETVSDTETIEETMQEHDNEMHEE